MALTIVLQHVGMEICDECDELINFQCPDPWLHEDKAGCCSDCESILDIIEEHHEECAMRALCRLALTSSEFRPKGARKNYFVTWGIAVPGSSALSPPRPH